MPPATCKIVAFLLYLLLQIIKGEEPPKENVLNVLIPFLFLGGRGGTYEEKTWWPRKKTLVAQVSSPVLKKNKVIHEGWNLSTEVDSENKKKIQGLLKIISALLFDLKFKFPSGTPGNCIMPPEEWEKIKRI